MDTTKHSPETPAKETDEPTTDDVATSNGAGDGTLVASLREKRQAISRERHLDIDIPGYDGYLVGRYEPVEWDEMKQMGLKLQKSKHPQKELLSQCDLIARACIGLYIRQDGVLTPIQEAVHADSDLRAVVGDLGDEPVLYDNRLAKFLGFEAGSARQVIRQTFNNDLAVTAHHNELGEWMQDSQTEDDAGF